MRHNGALEQRFLIYAFHMAITSKEARGDPGLRITLQEARNNINYWLKRLPLKKGVTPLRRLPTYERWRSTCKPAPGPPRNTGKSVATRFATITNSIPTSPQPISAPGMILMRAQPAITSSR